MRVKATRNADTSKELAKERENSSRRLRSGEQGRGNLQDLRGPVSTIFSSK